MGQDSKIQWTTHTFNPWRGCTKVSDGCKFCYADKLSARNPKVLGVWGPNGTRVVASDAMWKEPLKWNAMARVVRGGWEHNLTEPWQRPYERPRVFCASLADIGEGRDTMPEVSWNTIEEARIRLEHTIAETPELDWLLLTKRPENLPGLYSRETLERCWIGTSVENQKCADERIPHLLKCPAAVRFLSCEPLLGPIDLTKIPYGSMGALHRMNSLVGYGGWSAPRWEHAIGWVIVGGESGPGARPCSLAWIRSVIAQCKDAGVACFTKQLGASPVHGTVDEFVDSGDSEHPGARLDAPPPFYSWLKLKDSKGGDPSEWTEDLRVRQFPHPNPLR